MTQFCARVPHLYMLKRMVSKKIAKTARSATFRRKVDFSVFVNNGVGLLYYAREKSMFEALFWHRIFVGSRLWLSQEKILVAQALRQGLKKNKKILSITQISENFEEKIIICHILKDMTKEIKWNEIRIKSDCQPENLTIFLFFF